MRRYDGAAKKEAAPVTPQKETTRERKKKDRDLFYQGFAVAVGTLARNGYPSMARDIMQTNGVSIQQLRGAGAEKFDMEPLSHD